VTEEQKGYLRQLEESGYLEQIREFARARCAPSFWSSQESHNRRSCGTTITYVGTGQRDLPVRFKFTRRDES
jgi:hypothetical protein